MFTIQISSQDPLVFVSLVCFLILVHLYVLELCDIHFHWTSTQFYLGASWGPPQVRDFLAVLKPHWWPGCCMLFDWVGDPLTYSPFQFSILLIIYLLHVKELTSDFNFSEEGLSLLVVSPTTILPSVVFFFTFQSMQTYFRLYNPIYSIKIFSFNICFKYFPLGVKWSNIHQFKRQHPNFKRMPQCIDI